MVDRVMKPSRLVAALAALAVSLVLGVPAAADPEVANPDGLLRKYSDLARQSERSAEAMHNAQITYDKANREVATSKAGAANAQKELTRLQARERQLTAGIDQLVSASYRGARVNRLYALLVSDSPQNLLDQMSTLEMLNRQAARDVTDFRAARTAAQKAKSDADAAVGRAETTLRDARGKQADLQAKQSRLQMEIAQVKAVYSSLTGKQLAELRGPKVEFDASLLPKGTSKTAIAVQAAVSRVGDPYVWGATGPHEFDCSGLMVWAYKQAGLTIPRSSQAQQQGGKHVDRKDLQPGDLIIINSDASHVAMYVGNGYAVHASTFGVPVKVVPMDKAGPYNEARRYA